MQLRTPPVQAVADAEKVSAFDMMKNDLVPLVESQNTSNYTDLYALRQYKIRWWFDEKIKQYKLYDNGLLFKEFDTLDEAYEKIFEITR